MVTRPDVRADVVVLTAIDLEYAAVRVHLTGPRTYTDANGTRYETGELSGGRGRVALALTGQGNLAAAALTSRALAWFRPKVLVLVGVAGGLTSEMSLGDVVVATRVHAYHGGRAQAGEFIPRPKSWPISHVVEQDARAVARDGTWTRLLPGDHVTVPAVHFKPIVSGEVVLDARSGVFPELITRHYNDAVAIDMESAGVAEAAHHNDFYYTITVRGISDHADGTKRATDAIGWQHRAAAHAAAFAVALAGRIVAGPGSTRPVGVSPYRGLAPFGEDDAALFFGRAEMTGALTERVSRSRFVAVVGRSGSGKSSLVNAGLVPGMRRRGWAIAAFRPLPGVPAAVTLAGGLLPLLRPGLDRTEALAHREMLAQAMTSERLPEVLGEVLGATGADRLLVCVDQFEELVAWSEDVARELAGLLVRVATGPVPATVVLTVRTETLDVAVHRLDLLPTVFLITPMSAEQLREAVEGPVRSTGVSFEPGLVARILEEARDAPAALTLTQFALTRLWDEQDHGRLTHHAYDSMGGVGGALASYAEQVWAERLDETQRGQARRLLVQLVRPEGDGVVRRTARGRELAPELLPLASHLATTRLLVTGTDEDGETTIDLAHAALATHWQRLRDWLAEERDFRVWQEDLRESVRRAEPLRGARLTDALRWLRTHPHGVSAPEREFIRTSRRRRRLRTAAWRGLLVIIVGLLVVATSFAVILNERSEELAAQARQNAADALVVKARERSSTDTDTAALLSVAAYRAGQEPSALANLAGQYQRYRDTDRMINAGVGQILELAMSADGRTVAAAGIHGTALLRLDGKPVVLKRRAGQIPQFSLSADGGLLAGVTEVGRIELWRPDGSVTELSGDAGGRPTDLRFAGDGTRLLANTPWRGLVAWDVVSGDEVPLPAGAVDQVAQARATVVLGQSLPRVWFGPDDASILVATNDELRKWPLDGRPGNRVLPLDGAETVLVTGDGRTAVTCAEGALVHWAVDTATERSRQPIPELPCPDMLKTTADHAGETVAVQTPRESESHPHDGLLLMDTAGAPARLVVPAPTEQAPNLVPRLATTAEGLRLVTAIGTAMAVVDLASTEATARGRYDREPMLSPDLRHALTTSLWGETLNLWDTATGEKRVSVANEPRGAGRDRPQPRLFTVDGDRLVAVEPDHEHLVIHDVPSLDVVADVELPAEMRTVRSRYPGRFNSFCIVDVPGSREIAIVHAGLVVRVDVRSGAVTQEFPLGRDEEELLRFADIVNCVSRPGHAEVAFDVGRDVEVWDLDRGERSTTLPGTGVGTISSLRFRPDGRQLAVTGFDGSMEVWDVERRRPAEPARKVIDAHLGVQLAGFPHPDRLVLRSGGMLRVWDLRRDAAIGDVETDFPFSATVAPDGSTLVYWSHGGLTRMPLDPRRWADHLCRVVGRDLTDAERRDLPAGSPPGPVC
jgi:nucleoside phosphorylase